MSQTPPGWYPDPHDPTSTRYWDGQQWTENRAPVAGPRQVGADGKEQEAGGVIIAGYIFAVLMPIVGFIIGLTQINRNRHGLWVVIVSVVAFLIWLGIFQSQGTTGFIG